MKTWLYAVASAGFLCWLLVSRFDPLVWLQRRRWVRTPTPGLEWPWGWLHGTGNGTGGAPASLRDIQSLEEGAFDELLFGELYDHFWHQGTTYAATPFAIAEVADVLERVQPARAVMLLRWMIDCLAAERLGPAKASHAGVALSALDHERLRRGRVVRPTARQVLDGHLSTFHALTEHRAPEVSAAASEMIAALGSRSASHVE